MKRIILASLLSVFGTSAMADQCALITKPQAEKAVKILLDAQTVQFLVNLVGKLKPKQSKWIHWDFEKLIETYLKLSSTEWVLI